MDQVVRYDDCADDGGNDDGEEMYQEKRGEGFEPRRGSGNHQQRLKLL